MIPTSSPLKLEKGFARDKIVSTLFDLGANIMAIDQKLLPKTAYTGNIYAAGHSLEEWNDFLNAVCLSAYFFTLVSQTFVRCGDQ